jgi:hypothetical protein
MAFQVPIGTQEERESGIVWPGRWNDATPYLTSYSLGYHTGADLNLNHPHWDADRHKEVRAMGPGQVTYARLYSTQYWGNIIVIDHGTVDGSPLFSRYGHVENIRVAANQMVNLGDHIADVGNGEGLFPYHLHFDISKTEILRTRPGHWPGTNISLVRAHYVNPQEWLQAHVGSGPGAGGAAVLPSFEVWYVIATLGLRVRRDHSRSATQVGSLLYGTRVSLGTARVDQETYTWGQISGGSFNGDWIAVGKTDLTEIYLSRNPPV